jgi:hypothetical protein
MILKTTHVPTLPRGGRLPPPLVERRVREALLRHYGTHEHAACDHLYPMGQSWFSTHFVGGPLQASTQAMSGQGWFGWHFGQTILQPPVSASPDCAAGESSFVAEEAHATRSVRPSETRANRTMCMMKDPLALEDAYFAGDDRRAHVLDLVAFATATTAVAAVGERKLE